MEIISILISVDEYKELPELDSLIRSVIPDVNVLQVSSMAAARISLLNQIFDLVILDDDRADLITFLRNESPGNQTSRLLMLTEYSQESAREETGLTKTDYSLPIPFTSDQFKECFLKIIKEIKEKKTLTSSSHENQQDIVDLLKEYHQATGATCVFISDINGSIIHTEGLSDGLHLPVMAALLSGSMVTLIEAGSRSEGDQNPLNFLFHEGKDYCVYSINIGHDYLLNTIMGSKNADNKVGLIWFYAKPVSQKLSVILSGPNSGKPGKSLHSEMSNDMLDEFDKLLLPIEKKKGR